MMLVPILLMGHGRSGTRAMMSLLGTDPAITFERAHDFQVRQLTYLAKLSILIDRRLFPREFPEPHMREFDDSLFGPPPWAPGGFLPYPATMDMFPHLWEIASRKIPVTDGVKHYAEKAPSWLSAFITPYISPFNIFLFRDPRDIYLSAMAYMQKRGNLVGFGRNADDSDESFVRAICLRWAAFYLQWLMSNSDPRSVMFRYEDFVRDPHQTARELNKIAGLRVDPEKIEEGLHHRTTATTADSIFRHRRFPLPPELSNLFAEYLGNEMEVLGYGASPQAKFSRIHFNQFPITSNPDGQMSSASAGAVVSITGPDFHFPLPIDPFNAADVHSLWLSARAPLGDHCTIYWRRPNEAFSEERAVYHRYFPGAHWRILDFNLATHPLWTGTIAELRLDLFNFTSHFVPGSCEVIWFRLIAHRDGFSKC